MRDLKLDFTFDYITYLSGDLRYITPSLSLNFLIYKVKIMTPARLSSEYKVQEIKYIKALRTPQRLQDGSHYY